VLVGGEGYSVNFEGLGKILANYFDFFIAFATHPSATLKRLERTPAVDPTIAQHFLVGIAIAVGLGLTTSTATTSPASTDASATDAVLSAFGRVEPAARPLLAVAAIFAFAVLAHLTVRLIEAGVRFTATSLVTSDGADWNAGGTVHATVNAVLALSACYVPILVFVFAAESALIPRRDILDLTWVLVAVLLLLIAALYAYLLLALSATHGVPPFTMLTALFFFVLPFFLIGQNPLWLVPLGVLVALALFRRLRRRQIAVAAPQPPAAPTGEQNVSQPR